MKVELANKNVTKLMMTGISQPEVYRSTPVKIKDCPGLFHKALINYFSRIHDLYDKVMFNIKNYKIWYCWSDNIKINIVNKNFGLIYTGSVIYGFKILEGEEDGKTKQDFEFEKYYIKGKNYIKRNYNNTVFELEYGKHGPKLKGVWTGFRKMYKDMSPKELWKHNLEILQLVRGKSNYTNEFVDGYSKAINEYLATL